MRSSFLIEGGRHDRRRWWWLRAIWRAFTGRMNTVHLESDDDFEVRFWQRGADQPVIVRGYRRSDGELTITVESKGSPYLKRRSNPKATADFFDRGARIL